MRQTQQKMVVAAWCSTAVAPPPVVVGGEGGDRAGTKLGDGVVTPSIAGEGAINPCERSCGAARGHWYGPWTQARTGANLLGDGVVTRRRTAGEGAIDPLGLPPMLRCGWEGGDRAGIEQWAELRDGVATPVVAGKGGINPAELLHML
jgi:hypothetical protein